MSDHSERKTILLVEDEVIIAMAEKQELEGKGYSVILAHTGKEAIKKVFAGGGPVDLILMDIDLGRGQDGTEAAREILRRRDIPVVFLSSHTEKEVVEKTEQITSYGYVVKNTGITVLDASIKMAFRLHAAHAALKNSEETLRESEEKYRRLFESAPVGIFTTNSGGHALSLNRAMAGILGFDSPAGAVEHYADLGAQLYVHAERRNEFLRLLKEKGSVDAFEYEARRFDGRVVWLSMNARLREYEQDGEYLIEGFTTDVTGRKEAEKALLDSERYLRTVLQTTVDGFWVINTEGKVVDVNNAYCALSGYKREELLKLSIADIDAAENPAETAARIQRIISKGSEIFETRHRRKDGGLFDVEISVTYSAEEGGKFICFCRDITGRRNADEALRRERDRARQYLDLAGVIFVAINREGAVTLVNARGCEVLGYGQDEIVGKNWFDCFLPAGSRETVRAVFRQLMAGEIEPVEYFENTVMARDGGERIIAWHNTILTDDAGMAAGTLSSGEDITERKRMEKELRDSEALLKTAQSLTKVGGWRYEVRTGAMYWTDETYRIHGFDPDEFRSGTGDHVARSIQCYDEPYQPVIREAFRKCVEEGTPYDLECRFLDINGKQLWIRTTAIPEKEEGKIVAVIGNIIDITAQKKTEEAQRVNEERLRLAHKATRDVVWDWDIVRDEQRWNESGTVVFGWTDIVERPQTAGWWVERVHPDDRERVDKSFFDVVNDPSKDHWTDEYRFMKADGSYAAVLDRGYVLRDERGGAVRMIGAMLDITVRKESEEKIRGLLLEKELVLKEVHHRIKNNMQTVQSLLRMQARRLADPGAVTALEDAAGRVNSMMTLYDGLYRSSNVARLSLKDYLPRLVRQVIDIFPVKAVVAVETEIEDIVLEAGTLSSVGIIINELVTNAMRHAFESRKKGLITLKAARNDNRVVLQFADDGAGMTASAAGEVSSGFGLRLVELLVQQIEGTLSVETNGGTRFIIEFNE